MRDATPGDVDALVDLINLAYRVEDFFIDGNRTFPGEIEEHMGEGPFIVLQEPAGNLAACLFLRIEGEESYFGMLSVTPTLQGRGLGRRLIAEAERRARDAGCRRMRLIVVNHREELFPMYRRLGYRERATYPFTDTWKLKMPSHFVEMARDLSGND